MGVRNYSFFKIYGNILYIIWRINMNCSYENLPEETKKVINAAINRRINGNKVATDSDCEELDCYILLMTIIQSNEKFQKILNVLNPEFIDKLEMDIYILNGEYIHSYSFEPKSSTNYERDYRYYEFEKIVREIIEFLNQEKINFRAKHSNEDVDINILSPNVIAWSILHYKFVWKMFNRLDGKPNVAHNPSEVTDSLYFKFMNFLNDEMIKEKSITFTKNKKSTELDTFIKENDNQTTVSQTLAEKTITEDNSSPVFDAQTEEEKKKTSIVSSPENIKKMLASIEQKFIGQENAAKLLFFNIIKNQKLASIPNIPSGTRSIMFIDGPSGTGKTAITKDITDNLGLPFVATSITNYSASGYVGGNITDILKELYVKSGGDLSKAERGIVVLDELDKIVNNSSRDLTMKTAVQHQLLDFLGGGKYTIEVDKGQTVEFDTSKLTFVCLGALTNLRNDKMQMSSSRPIGFNVKYDESTKAKDYSITPEDLIKMGFEKELVGRFNTYVHTKDYSKSDLKKILLESKISPLIGFKTLVSSFGKKLVIDEDAYDLIAEAAYDLNTGAWSLQTVVNNLNSRYLEELLVGAEEEIHITFKDVKRINEAAFKEKGRC